MQVKEVSDLFPVLQADLIKAIVEEQKHDFAKAVQTIIDWNLMEDHKIMETENKESGEKRKRVVGSEGAPSHQKEEEEEDTLHKRKREKREKRETARGECSEGEKDECNVVVNLQKLCMNAARRDWRRASQHLDSLSAQMQEVVIEHMWRTGAFDEQVEQEKKDKQNREMAELKNFFDDLISGAEQGEVVYTGTKGKLSSFSSSSSPPLSLTAHTHHITRVGMGVSVGVWVVGSGV